MKTVTLTQYLRPNGKKVPVEVEVPNEVADMATGMELSCEVLMSGIVVLYGRKPDWDEEDEIMETATNSPGPNQPDLVLARVIEKVAARES